MRNKLLLVFGLVMLLIVVGCSSGSNDAGEQESDGDASDSGEASTETFELKFAHVQPDDHPTSEAVKWASEELEKLTDGQVSIKLYAGGALGGPDENIAAMDTGDVDMAWYSSGDLARQIKEFNVFGVSYLIKDNDHFVKVASPGSDLMNTLDQIVEEANLGSQLIGMMGGSPRRLYNSERAVNTPEDLNGLSIRIQDSPVEGKVWSALGAKPVPLAWSEIYTALQSGVVDGAESSTSAYDTNKLYEVAPYHSLTEHQYMFLPVLMSDKTMEKLPEDLLEIVLSVMEEASQKSWEIFWEEDERLVTELAEQDVHINEVDVESFMEIVAPIADEVAEENDAEVILSNIREAIE